MKILFLAENFSNWVTTTLYDEQRAILKLIPDGKFYGPGFNDYKTNDLMEIIDSIYGNSSPDVVFCYVNERRLLGEPICNEVIKRYKIPPQLEIFPLRLNAFKGLKICWINDFWHCSKSEWEEILLTNGFDYAFATYAPPFLNKCVFKNFFSLKVRKKVRFIPWPRAVNPEIFFWMNLEKKYDVTILGAMDKGFYPLRNYFHQVLSNNDKFKYFYQNHPGYIFIDEGNDALSGRKYAQVINQSKIFASCTGIYRIPFIKIYEIMACGTALCCDEPNGAEYLGMEADKNYIKVNAGNFVKKIENYLKDPDRLNEISKNGSNLISERHTIEIRAKEFLETIKRILTGENLCGWGELYK